MKKIFLLILSVCLLAIVGNWIFNRPQSDPGLAPSDETAASNSDSIPTDAAPVIRSEQSSIEALPETIRPRHRASETKDDASLTDSKSPSNTQDEDANREWARSFPAAALAWLQSAPEGKQRDVIAEIVCADLAQTDPAAAVVLAERCLSGSTNSGSQSLVENMTQQWAGNDFEAASTWALSKPAGEQRDRLLQRIAFVEAKNNPKQAAQRIVEQMSPGPAAEEAAVSVLHQWALKDPAAALAWAESFPAGTLRERAINEVRNVTALAVDTNPEAAPPQ